MNTKPREYGIGRVPADVNIVDEAMAELEAAAYADLAIGFGVDGAGIDRAEFAYYNEITAAAASNLITIEYPLFPPIRIAGSPRVAGRIRKSSAVCNRVP